MNKLKDAQVGDFAKVYMLDDGQITETEFDGEVRKFEIIAVGNDFYGAHYVLVTYKNEFLYGSYRLMEDGSNLDYCSDWTVESVIRKVPDLSKYKNHLVRWLDNSRVAEVIKAGPVGPDGCNCSCCREFYPMAVPNQPDNTLLCWACRANPMRKYY